MTRTKRLPALALGGAVLLLPAFALAQDTGGFGDEVPATDPTPAPDVEPTVETTPVYTPDPTPAPEPPAASVEEVDDGETAAPSGAAMSTPRPDGMSFAMGFSYLLGGAEFDRPDGASVRLRLESGLTLEPFARLATHGQSTMDGDFKNAQNEFIIGSNVRIPLKSRGKVDLVGVVGGGLGVFINDPDGDDNNTTITTFTVDYGLSLEYWVNNNWNMSFNARNQFVRYQGTSQQQSDDLAQSDTDIGVIWDPVVELALHLYF